MLGSISGGKKERCEFCKIPELLKSKDPASCITWEENNTKLGRVFENHDSLIVWKGKKLICSRPMILQKCFSLQNVQPEILFVMCGTEQAERRCWKKNGEAGQRTVLCAGFNRH